VGLFVGLVGLLVGGRVGAEKEGRGENTVNHHAGKRIGVGGGGGSRRNICLYIIVIMKVVAVIEVVL